MDTGIPNGIYRHYKGKLYEVLGTARHSETEVAHVIYKTLYGDRSTWIRPLDMFVEEVTADGKSQPRFSLIESKES